jgi:cell wall-associated NlpC family hydrolase
VSTQQVQTGRALALDPSGLRPGDILGFSTDDPGKTSHVGLYVGNGEFIHSGSRGVSIANLDNPYWQEHLIAARRVVP